MTIEERFMDRVFIMTEGKGCWLWTGKVNAGGYGSMRIDEKETIATRISLEMFKCKAPPKRPFALHTCGVRGCVRPDHLYWGTKKQNAADSIASGTFRFNDMAGKKGTSAYNAILSDADIMTIRHCSQSGLTQQVIADRFGVCRQHISEIVLRKQWQHLPDPPPQSTTTASPGSTTTQ